MSPVNRRGMLRLIGGAPFVARKAVEKLAGVVVIGERGNAIPQVPMEGAQTIGNSRNLLKGRLLHTFLKKFGLPSWKKRQIRSWARASRLLDPDIASLRSVSVSAKLRMQWERNEKRQEEDMFSYLIDREDQDAYMELHNTTYF